MLEGYTYVGLDAVTMLSALGAGLAVIFYFWKNDEFPLVLWLLYLLNGLYRYKIIAIDGKASWTNVAWTRSGVFANSNELGLVALNYFLLGTWCFAGAYMIYRVAARDPAQVPFQRDLFYAFINRKRKVIVGLFVFFLILNTLANSTMSRVASEAATSGERTDIGLSYAIYLPFALGGFILLMFLIYKTVSMQRDMVTKLFFLGLIVFSAVSSYNPFLRFGFLSWSIALGIMIVRDRSAWVKAQIYAVGGAVLMIGFGIAGLARTPGAYDKTFEEKIDLAIERLVSGEDTNLIDGFTMSLQVYPDLLDYQYGFQHFEILLRPIPRAIWPDKPLGGYINKLGLNDVNSSTLVGISESIYGTFYGEGGVPALIFLSCLYGVLFARGETWTQRFAPEIRYLIRGMLVASLIALIRGGDLAGIIAFMGMSYWPVVIMLRAYSRYSKRFDKYLLATQRAQTQRAAAERATAQRLATEAQPPIPAGS